MKINQKLVLNTLIWLHGIRSYDLANGVGIDYMHCVMLVVMKLMLKLRFSNEHEK